MTINEMADVISECIKRTDDDELKQKLKKVLLELMKIEMFINKYARKHNSLKGDT